MKCKWYLCKKQATANSNWCSRQCNMKASVTRLRQERKQKAVDYKGGKCQKCGYNKSLRAMNFHHSDPTIKEFGIGSGDTKTWEKLKVELDKCELLCANCHAEHHEKEYASLVGDSLIRIVKEHKGRPKCIDCKIELQYGRTRCLDCFNLHQEGIEWPSIEELKNSLNGQTYQQLANKLGVAYSTLWKRINNPRPSRNIQLSG